MARALDLTPANIRYHLQILLEEGWIKVTGQRPAGGAGRPRFLYNLSAKSLGESLEILLGAFLEVIEREIESISTQIAETLAKDLPDKRLNKITQYNQGVEFLNQLNYHASWGPRPKGPQVELRHCPYKELPLTHPHICRIDQRLISRLFDIKMKMSQRREFGVNPYSPCVFIPESDLQENLESQST
jgi:predicted ArsR family transcriptional regulator